MDFCSWRVVVSGKSKSFITEKLPLLLSKARRFDGAVWFRQSCHLTGESSTSLILLLCFILAEHFFPAVYPLGQIQEKAHLHPSTFLLHN